MRRYAVGLTCYSALTDFREYHTQTWKASHAEISPLSYENIRDKLCVKRLKACWHNNVQNFMDFKVISFSALLTLEFMKYCYKCLGEGGGTFLLYIYIYIYIYIYQVRPITLFNINVAC